MGALRSSGKHSSATEAVAQNVVYTHPTIDGLTDFILSIITNHDVPQSFGDSKSSIEALIAKYSTGLDTIKPTENEGYKDIVVLITGSTGNIGAQMLETLLQNNDISRVYALNRGSKSRSMFERHQARFEDKALDKELLASNRVVFVEGDASQDSLGLKADIFEEVRINSALASHLLTDGIDSTICNAHYSLRLEIGFQSHLVVI